MAHFEGQYYPMTVETPKNEVMKRKKFVTAPRSKGMKKNGKKNMLNSGVFFAFANFFKQLPKMLDPKCYTSLEGTG